MADFWRRLAPAAAASVSALGATGWLILGEGEPAGRTDVQRYFQSTDGGRRRVPGGPATLAEGEALLRMLREAFAELPAHAPIKQPTSWNGQRVSSWADVLDTVVLGGKPAWTAAERFAVDVYGLPDLIASPRIRIQCTTDAATFYGSYSPPDDLDGQTIDLVATHNPPGPAVLDTVPWNGMGVSALVATAAEVHRVWEITRNRSMAATLGVLQPTVGRGVDGDALGAPQGHDWWESSAGLPAHKVVLSDHVPIAFRVRLKRRCAAEAAACEESEDHCELTVMSMNMLCHKYLGFSYWQVSGRG